MAFDSSVLYLVLKEIRKTLVGLTVKGVRSWKYGFLLDFGVKSKLAVNLSGETPSLFLYDDELEPYEAVDPPFILLLKKYLVDNELVYADQQEFDRVAIFSFEVVYSNRFVERKKLVLELIPRRVNAFLLGEEHKVIGTWRKGPTGFSFYLPPMLKLVNPLIVGEVSEPVPLDLFQGISKNVKEFMASHGNEPDGWNRWIRALKKGEINPVVFVNDEGYPMDYWILDYQSESALSKISFREVSQAIWFFITERIKLERLKEEEDRKRKEIEDRKEYLLKKREKLLSLVSREYEVRDLEVKGEILFANLSSIPAKAERVLLPNPYTGETEEIILDPSLSPALNAHEYFKRASKLRRGIEKAKEELKKLEEEMHQIEGLSFGRPYEKETEVKEENPLFREFECGKWRIMVGKDASGNDHLTFKVASPEDTWLHARGIPGSHVIIRNPDKEEVPMSVLEFAASLAAYYSKAKMDTKVPVDYTLVKYVKKHPSGRKGAVLIRNQKTIWVRPRSGETPLSL